MNRLRVNEQPTEDAFGRRVGETLAGAEPNPALRSKLAAAREHAVQLAGTHVQGSVLSRIHLTQGWRWGVSVLLLVAALGYWQQVRQQQNMAATQALVDEVIYYSLDY